MQALIGQVSLHDGQLVRILGIRDGKLLLERTWDQPTTCSIPTDAEIQWLNHYTMSYWAMFFQALLTRNEPEEAAKKADIAIKEFNRRYSSI